MEAPGPSPSPPDPDDGQLVGPFVDESPGGGKLTVALVVLAVVGFAVAAIYGFLRAQRSELELAPVAPATARPWAVSGHEAALDPKASTAPPDDPRFAGAIAGLKVGAPENPRPREPESTAITFDFSEPSEAFVPEFEVVRLDAALAFATPDGASGRVEWIGARTFEEARYDATEHRLALDFFRPDLSPIPEAEFEDLGIDQFKRAAHARLANPGTVLRMRLATEGLGEDVDWRLDGVFDAATGVRLSSGGSWSSMGATCEFTSLLSIFHPAPVTLVLDATHGPSREFEIEAAEGALVEREDLPFTIELLRIVDGGYSGHSRSGSSSRTMGEIEIRAVPSPTDSPECLVPLVVTPEVFRDAVSIEILTKDGRAVSGRRSTTAGPVAVASYGCAASDIAGLRVRYRPNWKRFLIDLPRLPGTPPANTGLADLLDVTVPYAVIDSDHDLRQLIAGALELESTGGPGGSWHGGPSPFPIEIRDETIAAIIQRHRDLFPDTPVRIDPAAGRIEFNGPAYRRHWLARLLGI